MRSGVACTRCGDMDVSPIKERGQWHCIGCGYHFSVKSGTIMHDSHLSLRKWFAAIYLLCQSQEGHERGKPDTVHASLPFQSAAAAGLLAVEIDKLSLGPVPGAPNYVEAKLDLTDQVLSVHRRPFVKCPACQPSLRSSGRRSTPLRGSRALASYQNGRDMPLTHHDFGGLFFPAK